MAKMADSDYERGLAALKSMAEASLEPIFEQRGLCRARHNVRPAWAQNKEVTS